MRAFFSTGEPSGDFLAASLATAMRERVPSCEFAGIGSERMEAAGIALRARTVGWASMGPVEAIRRIPPLLANCLSTAFWLRRSPWDLVVLVDFGAYNLRLAEFLRTIGYTRPILYFFPPGAWLDDPKRARAVVKTTTALTAFTHQRDFYTSLGLPIAYFGHPLVSLVAARPARPLANADGGCVAILPGSRAGEIARHIGPLLAAASLVRAARPNVRFVAAAADAASEAAIRRAVAQTTLPVTVVRGVTAAFEDADAAWIASGTAVLEAALRAVPAAAFYIIAKSQVAIAKRVWRGKYITLPNILLDREIVPEFLQDDATPQALADAVLGLLSDPSAQLEGDRELRERLGGSDALGRCADFALELARS
jgi:lipid-A-disaccharide synthase